MDSDFDITLAQEPLLAIRRGLCTILYMALLVAL